MHRGALVLLAALALLTVPAPAAAAKPKPVARADAASGSQRAIQSASAVRVTASARKKSLVRLYASFRTYARKAQPQVITRVVEVHVKKGRRRGVNLRLNRIGRKVLKSCAGGRVVVSAVRIRQRAGAPVGSPTRTYKKLRRDAAGCRGSAGGGSQGGS
ncbi:MAG: hypothetical protein M3340_01525, partial [Actinomycetota bacterium]|nr:hypothetical protein [Actinomycetota bacterium]